MNLVGGHRRGGLKGEHRVVVVGAVRQHRRPVRVGADILAVFLEPGAQSVVRRLDLFAQRFRGGVGHRGGFLSGDLAAVLQRRDLCLGVGEQRHVGATRDRRARRNSLHLVDRLRERERRRTDAVRGCGAGTHDQLIEGIAHERETRDVRLHVALVVDAVEIDEELRQSGVCAAAPDDVRMPAKPATPLGMIELQDPDVVRRLRVVVQQLVVELRLHVGDARAPPCELPLQRILAAIVEPVVLLLAPLARELLRAHRQLLFVLGVEIDRQPCTFSGAPRGVCGGRGLVSGGVAGGQGTNGNEQDGNLHPADSKRGSTASRPGTAT